MMNAQILKWSHTRFNSKLLGTTHVEIYGDPETVTCPVCGEQRSRSLGSMAKHGAAILAMVVVLLSVLAICTGILVATLNYARSEASRTLYEMQNVGTRP